MGSSQAIFRSRRLPAAVFGAVLLCASGVLPAQEESPETATPPDTASSAAPDAERRGRLVRPPAGWSPANPFLQEEAPPAVFDLDTGNTEVDLFLFGTWTARSQLATGLSIAPDTGITAPSPYPGFETEFFAQSVDLTLSLWLFQRYFFEASVADESDINTIAAGYYAAGDELVRELVFGNVPLAVQPYPYQYAGSPRARAGATPNPAAVLRLATAATYHELLVRLENSQAREAVFLGGRRLDQDRRGAGAWLRRRAFVLPDRPVQDLEVLVADPDGSVAAGSGWEGAPRFRRLAESDGDYVVDRSAGTLRLSESVAESGRTVAVFYRTAGGAPVGAGSAGIESMVPLDADSLSPTSGARIDFSFSSDRLFDLLTGTTAGGDPDQGPPLDAYRLPLADGRNALILARRGLWSPFEAANLYALPEGLSGSDDSLRVELVRRGTGDPIDNAGLYQLRRIPDRALVEVTAGRDPESLEYRYPFAARPPRTASAAIYGPNARRSDDPSDVDLLVRTAGSATEAGEVQLDGAVVPGSLSVSVDGRTLDGFSFDPASGLLTLPDSVSPSSRVEVRFREFVPGEGGSDLVVVSGNTWQPREELSMSLAAGLRWTLSDRSFSTAEDEHPGSVTLSGGVSHQGERLELEVDGAVQLTQADTTGLLRLAGAGPETLRLAPDAENLFPSAADAGTLEPADRVLPPYRDAWSVDALGNVSLLTYAQQLPADEPGSGARVGPWLANSSDAAYTGPVAVTEWDTLAPEAWAGTLLRFTESPTDLRDIGTLAFDYRLLPPAGSTAQPGGGTLELLIRVGATDEDLDGDGVLDEGRSRSDPLLEFNAAGVARAAGQDAPGLAAAHSEDANGNGVLDPAGAGGLLERTLSPNSASGAWQRASVDLSDLSSAERQLLADSSAVEIVVRNTDGGTGVSGGRLLVGAVELSRSGSGVRLLADGNGSARASRAEDPQAGDQSLRSRYPRVGERLAGTADEQRVYTLDWSGGDGTEVTLELDTAAVTTGRYATIGVYLYLDDSAEAAGSDDELRLRLTPYRGAPASETLQVTVPADELTGGWNELSIPDGAAPRIDGRPAGSVDQRPAAGTVLRRMEVSVLGMSQGRLLVDELHARDPQVGLAGAAGLELTWRDTVETGALAGLSYQLRQDLGVQTDAFRAANTTSVGRALAGTSSVELSRGRVQVGGEAGLRSTAGTVDGRFGHRLTVPLAPEGRVSVSEQFLRDYDRRAPVETRSLSLRLAAPPLDAQVQADGRADARETSQEWRMLLTPALPDALRVALSASASVVALDRTAEPGDYAERWAASTGRLVPTELDRGRREREQELGLEGALRDWSYRLAGGTTGAGSVTGLQEHRMVLGSNLPVDIRPSGRRPWRVSLSYDRRWQRGEAAGAGSFAGDRRDWAERFADEPLALLAPPFLEFFQPPADLGLAGALPTDGSRNYDARAGLSYSRAVGSRLEDLLVPSSAELSLGRDRSWEADSRADQRSWQAEFTAVAINLFGSSGSRPRSTRFESDEYRNALLLELRESPETGNRDWTTELVQETRLFAASAREISLESSVTLQGPDAESEAYRSTLGHSWEVDRAPAWQLLERVEGRVFYRHTQELRLEANRADRAFTTGVVELSHESALVVGANGQIAVYGDLGWQGDAGRYENGLLHLLGMAIGIEGRLQY
mgnify:FL=1